MKIAIIRRTVIEMDQAEYVTMFRSLQCAQGDYIPTETERLKAGAMLIELRDTEADL